MAWTAEDLPDLAGRTAVVTGANSGIGLHVARALAARGARVVLAGRNLDATREAAASITNRGGRAEAGELDLASMASVRAFTESWDGPLDLLVNNAGVMSPPKPAQTEDGFELQFGTNHLGHFVLTGMLLPALLASPRGRVVTVSSIAHHGGGDGVLEGNAGIVASAYNTQKTYGNSKLANLLFALQLQRELAERDLPVTSTAAHPGVSATRLFTSRQGMGAKPMIRLLAPPLLKLATQSPAAGARAVLYAATVAEPGSYTGPQRMGETRGPIGAAKQSSAAQDDKLARRLWHVSEELTGYRYDW